MHEEDLTIYFWMYSNILLHFSPCICTDTLRRMKVRGLLHPRLLFSQGGFIHEHYVIIDKNYFIFQRRVSRNINRRLNRLRKMTDVHILNNVTTISIITFMRQSRRSYTHTTSAYCHEHYNMFSARIIPLVLYFFYSHCVTVFFQLFYEQMGNFPAA